MLDEAGIVQRQIEKICKQIEVDIIVAGSNPFYYPLGAAKANCRCRKIWYQMDPHSENGMIREKRLSEEKKKEETVYSAMDRIYIQPGAVKHISSSSFARFANKIEPLYFPLIQDKEGIEPEYRYFKKGKVHCVYAGALMMSIRRPEYMLNLFSALKDQEVYLYIWSGNLTKQTEQELRSMLPENVVFCGSLAPDEMQSVLSGADVLVNLGNSTSNQFPSKVLDYISFRKPIINIYKIDDCPTLDVLEPYPLVLNVYEGNDYRSEAVHVDRFIRSSMGKTVDQAIVFESYSRYQIQNEAKRILQ